jgi:hypothetical protein
MSGGTGYGGMGMSFARPGGFGGVPTFSGGRALAFPGNHVAFNRFKHFPLRHHSRERFFFTATFTYDDGCWVRVQARWGWRWQLVSY